MTESDQHLLIYQQIARDNLTNILQIVLEEFLFNCAIEYCLFFSKPQEAFINCVVDKPLVRGVLPSLAEKM
jgi:hypothetical protein